MRYGNGPSPPAPSARSDRRAHAEARTPCPVDRRRRPHAVRDRASNPLGTKKGYDPYDSGKLGKKPEPPRKKDLRRLGEFLRLKKQAANNKDEE